MSPRSPRRAFSARELEVLSALADGLTQKQAAAQLGVSVPRIEQIVASIRRKTGAATTAQAIAAARDPMDFQR